VKQVGLRVVFLVCVLLGVCAFQAFAQEATLVGTVTDPSGAAVANAAIKIANTDTGQVRQIATNSEGQYLAPDLQIGHYTVRAEMAGFKAGERKDLVLAQGDRARLDFKLELGSATESVTVEAAAVAVQAESGEVSDVITGDQVSQISSNGRSIYSLAALTAGASSNMVDYQVASSVGADSSISFNGLRDSHNLWMMDGGEDLDRGGAGTLIVMPSIESIAEFRQLTSNYSAEYGLSSAGTMTLVVKSGVRDFHAEAWEFMRNEDLDAEDAFRHAQGQPIALNRLNNFGFNVGGPVFIPKVYNKDRNKTFFFYNMEWRKMLQSGGIKQTVPLASEYGGNLTAAGLSLNALHTPCTNQVSPAIAKKFADANLALSTPGAHGSCTYSPTAAPGDNPVFAAFNNNTIPASLLDPSAQALLKAGIFPAPTAGDQFIGGGNVPNNIREEIVRIDHHFTDKLWLFGHYVADAVNQTQATTMWSGDNVPTAGTTFANPSWSGVIHSTYTISPTLLNELAFNSNGNSIGILPTGVISSSTVTIPQLFPKAINADSRLPAISLSGATGTNYSLSWTPWTNKCEDYQIRDDFSWTKGAHQIKFGASYAYYGKAQTYFADTQGQFGFNGQYSGNDFADFLLGMSNSYSEDAVQNLGHWDNNSYAVYVQDNWKVSPRLTLNLGVRWDGIPHTYEADALSANFYPNLYNPANKAVLLPDGSISPTSPGLGTSPVAALAGYQFYLNGIGVAGQNGIPKGLVNNAWNNIAPRVGFAYDLSGQGKTVIRGGFGIMYERIQGNDMYNGATNSPFGATVSFNNVSLSNPNLSLLTGQTLVAPITVNSITGLNQTDYKAPTSNQYSIGVQQAIGRDSVLSVAYVGNQNRHQQAYTELNLPSPSLLPALINGTLNYNTVVPYAGYNSIKMSGNNVNSHYNSLQVNFHSRIGNDLSLQAVYTYSKAMDPDTGTGMGDMNAVSNPYDRSYDNGPSPFDRRNVGMVNFIYQIPILRGPNTNRALKATLGGWEVSGLVTMESGIPVYITLGGTQGSNGVDNGTNRPNVNGTVSYPQNVGKWFDTSAFSAPAPGSWGNLVRDSVYGPGRDNWNLSLFKSFAFSEARNSRLEIRMEAFNAFNHTQFNGVSGTFTASNFGQVTSMYNPRNIQLGAKLYF